MTIEKHTKPHTAIILTGIPASGKSTFFQNTYADTHVRINLDMLKNRRREDILIRACLEAKQSFVVDNTNVTVEQRKKYIELVNTYGKNEFTVVSVYFPPNLEDSFLNNSRRDRFVPEAAIKIMLSKFQEPSYAEGFDEIYKYVAGSLLQVIRLRVRADLYPYTCEVLS